VLLFLHGFATAPFQYRFTLEKLAAQGYLVWAPTLPDYFFPRIGYQGSVLHAALEAYDAAAQEARALGAPPPVVVGYSMGGGAALLVGAQRSAVTVLWAPSPFDRELPVPSAPLLVLQADQDCIVKQRPAELIAALGAAAQSATLRGNHLGFTDLNPSTERYDCPSPVSRQAQREDVVARTVDFLAAHRPSP
jgi:dienelactone hydrolase